MPIPTIDTSRKKVTKSYSEVIYRYKKLLKILALSERTG